MTQRVLAAVLAAFFLGLAALMASVTLFVREPLPVVGARTPLTLAAGPVGDRLHATLVVDPSFRFELMAERGTPGTGTPPTARLIRPQGDASPIVITFETPADGAWRGSGQFTLPGRWTLELTHAGDTATAPFILRE